MMGKLNVFAQLKVMPKDIDVDLGELMKRITESLPDDAEVEAYREEDIAYGLKALIINVLLEDKAGGTAVVEECILAQDGVQTVDVLGVTRF